MKRERPPMPSRLDGIINEVVVELRRANEKFPEFPTDPVHAAAIVAEEAGELVRESLQATYEKPWDWVETKKEAIHVAAMALRFLVMMHRMTKRPSPQVTEETTNAE